VAATNVAAVETGAFDVVISTAIACSLWNIRDGFMSGSSSEFRFVRVLKPHNRREVSSVTCKEVLIQL